MTLSKFIRIAVSALLALAPLAVRADYEQCSGPEADAAAKPKTESAQ